MAARPGPEIVLPPRIRRLVWVVDSWNPALQRPPGLDERAVAYGRRLYVLDLGTRERRVVEHGAYRLTPSGAIALLAARRALVYGPLARGEAGDPESEGDR